MQSFWILLLLATFGQVLLFQVVTVESTDENSMTPTNSKPGNEGNEFYIGFMDNYVKPAFQNIPILIMNSTEIFMTTSDATGAVAMIESEQGVFMYSVSPAWTQSRKVDEFRVRSGSDRNKGIKIKAEQVKQILVYGLNEEIHSVDSFTALPCYYLPLVTVYEYYAVSVPPSTTSPTTADSAFLIVACSDNTVVSVTPSKDIEHPYVFNQTVRAGTTFTTLLQERETLYVQDHEDLTGSRVESSKPISFFTGHECGNVPADNGECDHLVEQVPPTVTWGETFIVVPTATRTENDFVKVVASQDNTVGNVACIDRTNQVQNYDFTLAQAGHSATFQLPPDTYCFAETDYPILMVQFMSADPFMTIVPAVRQYLETTKFSTVNVAGLEYDHYINIMVPAGMHMFDPSSIMMDDSQPDTMNGWVTIPCPDRGGTCAHAAQMNITAGVHTIWNSNGGILGVTVYGLNYLESYGYVGGLKLTVPGYDTVPSPTTLFAIPGKSICLPCESGSFGGFGHSAAATWTRDGVVVVESGRKMIRGDRALCINDTELSDAGKYVCHVSGLHFTTELSVQVGIIVEPPKCGSNESGALIGIGRGIAYLDYSISSYQICCRVQGSSGYTVTWLRDGIPMANTNHYDFGSDYMEYSGTMTEGCTVYTCQVDFTATLTKEEVSTICIGDDGPPTHINVTGELSVLENSVASYQCSADGFPPPTRMWTAFRDAINPLPVEASDDGNGLLTLSVTGLDASRRYCCDVGNEHGDTISKCIMIDVLIPPEIAKGQSSPFLSVSVPYGKVLPLDVQEKVTITVGNNIMIPETYRLIIECPISRANPDPSIVWYIGGSMILGPQYTVKTDGSLVIEELVVDIDDGVYTCVADTPNVGQDEANSTVIVTLPPKINFSGSDIITVPGNCLDLTRDSTKLNQTQPIGVDLCVRSGVNETAATITLTCPIIRGKPAPSIRWFKDGQMLKRLFQGQTVLEESETLVIDIPTDAYGEPKQHFDGNYTCHTFNVAGTTSVESFLVLFGDIPMEYAITDFVEKQSDIYQQLHETVSEHFPGVHEWNSQHLMFLTRGKTVSYKDFEPGYQYDNSEESVLPQTMENMFHLSDVIPNGGSVVFNAERAQRLQKTYTDLVTMLHVAPSSLTPQEQMTTRSYFQEAIMDPVSSKTFPRLSLYLLYKNQYYSTKMNVDNLVDSKRRGFLGWEFTQWYERNVQHLQMSISDAYMKWEMYADKTEIEDKLNMLDLEDHAQDIYDVRASLLANHRMSRFNVDKDYYLVRFEPDTWYKELKNRIRESIEQMQYQLSRVMTEIEILEITKDYLEEEQRRRELFNALFPSLDPIFILQCDLEIASYLLENLVKESEDARYECIVTGNPVDCHLYWNLQDHIREQIVGNYTEFYWYVHTVESALNHREFSIPIIKSIVSKLQVFANRIQSSIDIAISHLTERSEEEGSDDEEIFTQLKYNPSMNTNYNFDLPSSLIGRLLWYINPESTKLLENEVADEYTLAINHLNTALTNVSAKLSKVDIHRRWFKAGIFGNKKLRLADPDVAVSPGEIVPPELFRDALENNTYQLPLYPTSILLATDIELCVDVPFIFHTLPTLIKLSYDPHVTGGFGPFSFGQMHEAKVRNMKFKVEVRDSKILITLPGTQVFGYVSDVVPQHPLEMVGDDRRSARSVDDAYNTDREFDQWLFSKKNKELKRQDRLFIKNSDPSEHRQPSQSSRNGHMKGTKDLTESFSMLITPSVPLNSANTEAVPAYYNSTL